MTISSVRPWRASPAHLRAVALGVLGVGAALLARSPVLLVMATPFAFVTVWSTAARPTREPTLTGRISPIAVREGEATSWTGELDDVTAVDHVVVATPERQWLETRPRSGVVVGSAAGDSTTVSLPIRVTHWGHHDVRQVDVIAVSAWGAFRWAALDGGYRVTALPVPERFDATSTRHRTTGLVGLTRSTRPGDGTDFAGLRPFRAGDRLRRINWRRSLRSDELHVTATYADQDSHVVLIVDALADFGTSGGVDGPASSLDTTVRAAGAIAEHFLVRGDRVSLRVLDGQLAESVPAGSGTGHLRRILDVLASIEPETNRRRSRRPDRRGVPAGAFAVVLSPLISPVALERTLSIASHGLSVAVIDTLPDDVHAHDDRTTELAWRIRLIERRREMRAVRRLGVPIDAWTGPGSLDPFLRQMAQRTSAPRLTRR